MPLLIGTSGWQYRDWRDDFYPPGLVQRRWLEYYSEQFPTVEVNNAFYRLPERTVFQGWRERTPAGFVIAVKASRYLTHVRRLREPAEQVRRLMDRVSGLGERLGPILLQLPPTMRADAELLSDCLRCFPAGTRVAVEPRHPSWFGDGTRAALERNGAALCWADRRGRPVTPLWRTTDWAYLRLHEGRAADWPRYGRRSLATWVARLADQWPHRAQAYVYFNNDQNGAAVRDARAFAAVAERAGRTLRGVRT